MFCRARGCVTAVYGKGKCFFGSCVCAQQRGLLQMTCRRWERVVSMEQRCMRALRSLLNPPERRRCGISEKDDYSHMFAKKKKLKIPASKQCDCNFNSTLSRACLCTWVFTPIWGYFQSVVLGVLLAYTGTSCRLLSLLEWSHRFGRYTF